MKRPASTPLLFLAAVFGAVGFGARADESAGHDAAGARAMITNVCEACHGRYGNSTDAGVPSLAGQGSAYLQRQLAAFQEQRRVGVMSGIAMGLNDAEIRYAATYFSQQIAHTSPIRAADSVALQRGAAIYNEGVAGTKVLACASCHALDGAGMPSEFPRLAGQHSRYIAEQLRAFRSDTRVSNPNGMMRRVSAQLSDEDITALADYIAELR